MNVDSSTVTHAPLGQDVGGKGGPCMCGGKRIYEKSLYKPFTFALNLKLLQKSCLLKKFYIKKLAREKLYELGGKTLYHFSVSEDILFQTSKKKQMEENIEMRI